MGKAVCEEMPSELVELLTEVGSQIKFLRLVYNYPMTYVAALARCSLASLYRIEQGNPNVSIGTYLRVLKVIKREKDILALAGDAYITEHYPRRAFLLRRQRAGDEFRYDPESAGRKRRKMDEEDW